MTHSALLSILYFCLWLHNDWGRSLETVCLFWCFSVILDLQLPLDSQLHISLCPHKSFCVSFLAQYWSRISSLLAGAPRLNSGNFDRISLPNIEKNGATPVIIWGVDLCAVTSLWRSCRKSFFNKVRFWRSTSPFAWGHRGGGGGGRGCSVFYPVFHKEGFEPLWNKLRTIVRFKCVGNSKQSICWLEAVHDLCAFSWPQDNYFKISAVILLQKNYCNLIGLEQWYFKLSWNTTALSQSNCRNLSCYTATWEISANSKYHSWYLCQISLQIMLLPIRIV